jgi:hypothetical protein
MFRDQSLERCAAALLTARELMAQSAELCETSRSLIDSSFRLIEVGDMKRSRMRSWLGTQDAIRHKYNGQAFQALLDLAIETSDADFGNIQVYDASARALKIVV